MVCANGFRDTTRIASGSPEMWRDIAMANRKNLSRVLGVFIEDLQEFRQALENGDVKAVEEFFEKAKQRRDRWVGSGNSPGMKDPENGKSSMALPELIEIVPLMKPARAEITVPGSKSITNRALILAALANGESTLQGRALERGHPSDGGMPAETRFHRDGRARPR